MPSQIDDPEFDVPAIQPATRLGALTAGSWVTGRTPTGIFGFSGHKGHIFELLTEPADRSPSNSGYGQDVACILDGEVFKEVDGEFLQELADREALLRVDGDLRERRRQSKFAHERVKEKLSG